MATTPQVASQDPFTPKGDLRRRTARGSAVMLASQAGKLLLQTGSTAILARLLSPTEFGKVAMVAALLGIVTLLKDFGLSTATIQRKTINHSEVTFLFWFNVAVGVGLAVVLAILSPLVGWLYRDPSLVPIAMAFALMAPISSLGSQHAALLQRQLRFEAIAIRDLVALLVGTVTGIAAAWAGMSYWSLVAMQAATTATGVLLLWMQSGWTPGAPTWDRQHFPMLRFGGSMLIANTLGYFMRNTDSMALGLFYGSDSVGIYTRAQNLLSRPLSQVIPPLSNVAVASMSRIAGKADAFASMAQRVLELASIFGAAIIVSTLPVSDLIVTTLLGPKWMEAVPIFACLAVFGFVEPFTTVLSTLLVSHGQPGRLAKWRAYSVALVLTGICVGLPWGAIGVAIAYSGFGILVRTPLFLWYAGVSLKLPVRRLFAIVGTYLGMGSLVCVVTHLSRLIWQPPQPVAACVFYAAFALMLYLVLVATLPGGRAQLLWVANMVIQISDKRCPAFLRRFVAKLS